MKLTVLQENLSKAVNLASRFASTRSQLPILGNVLLTATKSKLNISATNLEISVSTSIGAKTEEEGELSIPSRVINEIVSNLPKESIELESDKEQLKISAPSFSSTVLGMNSGDFPKIPNSIDKEKALNFKTEDFINSLPKVLFATGVDETRPILTGVLLILGDSVSFVATDGFRLSKKEIPLSVKNPGKIVIPKGILNEVLRTSENTENIFLNIQDKEKQIVFGMGDTILTSRLLEGEYPDFEKIIPKSADIKVFVDKEDFLRSVKLASIFARDSANIVKIKLLKDSMDVFAESSAAGHQKTNIETKIEGEVGNKEKSFETAFNFHFLEDFIHSVSGEEIEMDFTTPDKAGVFKDTSDKNYLHLIMPVKIQN